MKRTLSLFLLILLTNYLLAAEPYYFKIDKLKGLPSNTVFDAFQDSKGFMWFAGSFGLCRFDGELFHTYNVNTQSSKSGSGIKEDRLGRIWYCNFDGQLFYVEQGKLHQFKQSSLYGYHQFACLNNKLYVIEHNEIAIYDIQSLKKTAAFPLLSVKIGASYSNESIFYVYADKLYAFQTDGKVSLHQIPADVEAIQKGIMLSALNGDLMFASKESKKYFLWQNGVFNEFKFSENEFTQNISATADGTWLCTTNGIIPVKTTNTSNNNFKNQYLEGNNVSDVLVDKDGHFWVTTLDKGIRFIPNLNNEFIYSNIETTTLEPFHQGLVLCGLNSGDLNIFDPKTNQQKLLQKGASNHGVYFLYHDSIAGNIFSTSNTFKVNNVNGTLKASSVLAVKSVAKIDNNMYAYAASGSCGVLSIANKAPNHYHEIYKIENSFTDNNITFSTLINDVRGKSVVYNQSNHTLYFATNKGLYGIKGKRKFEFKSKKEIISAVKLINYNNSILGLTTNRQVFSINNKNKFNYIDISESLGGQQVSNIFLSQNKIFLFTRYSVYALDVETYTARKLASINLDFELNDIEYQNGGLQLATNNGIITLQISQIFNSPQPIIYVDSVWVNKQKLENLKSSKLAYYQKNLTFFVSLLNFEAGTEPHLAYRINKGNWTEVSDNRRSIEINDLKPGSYSIEFIYGNNVENANSKLFEFEIDKPYWSKAWFVILALLMFSAFLYFFDRWRTKRINHKSQELIDRIQLEKMANISKLKAIKSQMNPHFFYNALNTIQSFILDNDKRQAITYLSKFSSLTRSILEMSDKDEVTVTEEINVLKLYLDIEKARFNDEFEYQITSEDIDNDQFKIPSLLLQPFVENAVKHGLLHKKGVKKLEITFQMKNENFQILISDNGIGRKKSMELNAIKNATHKSFATQATENRVSLLNEYSARNISIQYIDMQNEAEKALGTTVIVTIMSEKGLISKV